MSKQADQTGALTLSGSTGGGTLLVAAGASYAVLDDADTITSYATSGAVLVSGLLTESGTGTGVIAAALTLANSGTLAARLDVQHLVGGGERAGVGQGDRGGDHAGVGAALRQQAGDEHPA